MNDGSARPKYRASERLASERLVLVIGIILLAIITSGCQSDDEVTPVITEMPTTVRATITPIVLPSATSQPTASNTAVPVEPTAAQPTVTSPVPSRTPLPTATPTPIPPPEPTFHIIEPGDTLLGIAETYEIDVEALALANGYFDSSEMSLIAGQEVQIPLCEIHEVVSGNTLAGIALSCGVALDDLISTNISELALLGSLDAIPLTFLLLIPQESDIPEDLDCSLLPEREQVIEYSPGPGEGIFCLSQKYDISTTTLLRANLDRLTSGESYGAVPLLILPYNGALYGVTDEDITNNVALTDLAAWYAVEPDAITDWNGNLISDPLMDGQQLLIAGADLLVGPFRFQLPE